MVIEFNFTTLVYIITHIVKIAIPEINQFYPKKILNSSLAKGSLLVIAATFICNILNYSLHLISARILQPADYGLFQSLIASTYFFAVIVQSFGVGAINFFNQNSKINPQYLLPQLQDISHKLALVSWFLLILSYPIFSKIYHLDNLSTFFIYSLIVFAFYLPNNYYAVLRSRLRYKSFALLRISSITSKFIVAVILTLLGFKLNGLLTAFIVVSLSGTLIGKYLTNKQWPIIKQNIKQAVCIDFHFWKFSVFGLLTNLVYTSFYSSDIILARYFLPEHEAGIYSGLSILGKIIFFIIAPIVTITFPIFNNGINKKRIKKIFKLTIILIVLILVSAVIAINLFSNLTILVLIGKQYKQAQEYIFQFSIFISLLSLTNFFTQFLLATKQKAILAINGLGALLQIILILVNHQEINAIITSSLIALSFSTILSGLYSYKTIKSL